MKKTSKVKKLVNALLIGVVSALALAVTFVLNATITASVTSKNKHTTTEAPNTKPTTTEKEVMGNGTSYYFDQGGKYYTLVLTDKNQFSLSMDGEIFTGKFVTGTDGTLAFVFDYGVDLSASAKVVDGNVELNLEGYQYTFAERKQYTVSFLTNGGNDVESQNVMNGKYAVKPADPTKANGAFVGWYVDADYSKLFDFQTMKITENTTVYGRFADVTVGQVEYTASFMSSGSQVAEIKTIGGVVYNLPVVDDANFVGWFVSESGVEGEVTYKYDGQVLSSNATLYPVYSEEGDIVVSVDGNTISWTSVGVNQMYLVEFVDANGTVVDEKMVNNTVTEMSPSALAAGKYEVRVSANDKTGSAYKNVRVLNPVSYFNVVEGKILTFAKVDGATKYYVSIDCGVDGHNHTNVYLGSNTYYDFQNCQMKKGGINFTVTAVANNYESSVATFNYSLDLAAVENVVVDQDTDVVTWDKVENAVSYKVEVADGTNTYIYNVGTTEFDLKEFTGALTVSVTAVTAGYNSADATAVNYSKATLPTPKDVTFATDAIRWQDVAGATGYKVFVNGTAYDVTTNYLALNANMLVDGVDTYEVYVQAIASDEALNSKYSNSVEAKYYAKAENNGVLNVSYSNGTLSWDPIFGAIQYEVAVVDMSHTQVVTNGTSAKIEFFQPGKSSLFVRWYDMNANASEWRHIDVYAYEVAFQTTGGSKVDSLYFAYGDTLTLPTSAKEGYDFAGWYNSTMGVANNGVKYDNETVMGNSSVILFAQWSPKAYDISLDINASLLNGASVDQTVYYQRTYTLPVPTAESALQAFAGWYTDYNGAGVKYTDEKGVSVRAYAHTEGLTLYPYFADVLTFEADYTADKEIIGFKASKGPGIQYVTEITIPKEYTLTIKSTDEGGNVSYNTITKPVTQIIDFKSATSIRKISFPDTVTYIDTLTGFGYATALETIEMYDTWEHDSTYEEIYATYNGILYKNNTVNEVVGFEIALIPNNTRGEINLMEGLKVIPAKALGSRTLVTKVTVPYTVEMIESRAFSGCNNLTEVVFGATPVGQVDATLTLDKEIFYGCKALAEVNLPARVSTIQITSFDGMDGLKKVNVVDGASNYQSIDGVLTADNGRELVFCPKGRSGSYTIPAGVYTIGEAAFKNCIALEEVVIPEYVKVVGVSAFESCYNLKTVTFEGDEYSEPLTLKSRAFYGCSKITEFTIPENCTTIESYALFLNNVDRINVNTKASQVSFAADLIQTHATNVIVVGGSSAGHPFDLYIGPNVPAFDISKSFDGLTERLSKVEIDPANTNFKSLNGSLYDYNMTKLVFYTRSYVGPYTTPDTLEEISASVFAKHTNLTEVTIGANVKVIGASAFESCSNLSKVTFLDTPEGETPVALEIKDSAFSKCNNSQLTEIVLPTRLTKVGSTVFTYCNFSELRFPEGVTSIGDKAVSNCNKLTDVYLPSTLSVYGNFQDTDSSSSVIYSCASLKEIHMAENNPNFKAVDKVIYYCEDGVPKQAIISPASNTGDVVIPNTVNKISAYAFNNNKYLTSITFEGNKSAVDAEGNQGVLVVGDYAFSGCSSLTTVKLPGVVEIPKYAFNNCSELVDFVIPNTVTTIVPNAFAYATKYKVVRFEEGGTSEFVLSDNNQPFYNSSVEEIYLPERCLVIGQSSLKGIKKVVLSSSITTIKENAFNSYSLNNRLEEIVFPSDSNLTTIERYAFAYTNLKNVVLPAKVTSLGENAFYQSRLLEEVTFNDQLESIGIHAFDGCNSLTTINFAENSSLLTIGQSAFFNANLLSVTIPQSVQAIQAYAFANNNKLASVEFAEDAHITTLGGYVFQNDTSLVSVTFPTSITNYVLPANTFYGCSQLKTVNLSKSITDISGAFNTCYALETINIDSENLNLAKQDGTNMITNKSGDTIIFVYGEMEGAVTIPSTVKYIKQSVFAGQDKITSVVIPSSVISIGNNAFQACTGLTSVVFESGSPIVNGASNSSGTASNTLGTYAFNGCSSLTNVVLPEGLKTISEGLFQGCTSLSEITLPTTCTSLAKYAFDHCGFTELVIPETCYSFDYYAFSYNLNLTSITFGKITSCGSWMLAYNPKLTTVIMPEDTTKCPTKIMQSMFQDDIALTTFVIPASVTEIMMEAFAGCSSLENVVIPTNCTTLGASVFRNTGIKEITIPSKIANVTASAFKDATALETVHLNQKMIYANAFQGCVNLKTVTVNPLIALTDIYGNAFQGCESLETFTFPSSLKNIYPSAFAGSGLKEVFIPKTVTSLNYQASGLGGGGIVKPGIGGGIGKPGIGGGSSSSTPNKNTASNAFKDCLNLEKVTIEEGSPLTFLTTGTFQNCPKLKEVHLSSGIKELCGNVFQGCTSLTTINLENVTTYSQATAIITETSAHTFDGCESLEEVTLSQSVTKLTDYMFANCTSLTTINLDKITTIGKYAFQNCGLETINMPALTTTGDYAFSATLDKASEHGLVNIYLPKVQTLGKYLFQNAANLEVAELGNTYTVLPEGCFENTVSLKNIELSNKLTSLANAKLFKNSGLTNITIPDSVPTLGSDIFAGCDNLTSVTIPATLKAIPAHMFEDCTALTTVNFESGSALETIGAYAFNGCTALTRINLPESVTTIGDYAFSGTGLLGSFTFGANVSSIGYGAFFDCADLRSIEIDANNGYYYSKDGAVYTQAKELVYFPVRTVGTVTLDEGVTLTSYVFKGCNGITKLVLPADLKTLPDYALSGMANLAEVVFPETLETIGSYVFEDNNAIKALNLPASLSKELPNYAFAKMYALESFTVADGVTTIPQYAFAYCSSLKTVVLPASVNAISEYAFYKSGLETIDLSEGIKELGNYSLSETKLVSVTIPSTVTTFGVNVLANNEVLTEVVLSNGLTTIGSYMFNGSTNLKALTFPTTMANIPEYAFTGAYIEDLTFPQSVEYVDNNAFTGSFVKNVVLPEGMTTIGVEMFAHIETLESVVLPESVFELFDSAFDGCSNLKTVTIKGNLNYIGVFAFRGCTSIKEIVIPGSLLGLPTVTPTFGSNVGVDSGAFSGWGSDQTIHFTCSERSKIIAPWSSTWNYNTQYTYDKGAKVESFKYDFAYKA